MAGIVALCLWGMLASTGMGQRGSYDEKLEREMQDIAKVPIAKLGKDDARVKRAYEMVVLLGAEFPAGWMGAVSADMVRRGDEGVTILLELFEERKEGGFREKLMYLMEMAPGLKAERVLERVRRWVKEEDEGRAMPDAIFTAVGGFLCARGEREDMEILREMAAHDPKEGYRARTASKMLVMMEERLRREVEGGGSEG